MPVTLTAVLPPSQDSYLGSIYLGIETYLRRSGTGHGFPAAGAAPPDIRRQGLASRVGQAAHDDTGLRSPVPGNRRQQREPRPYRTQIPRSGASQTAGLRPHHHARSAGIRASGRPIAITVCGVPGRMRDRSRNRSGFCRAVRIGPRMRDQMVMCSARAFWPPGSGWPRRKPAPALSCPVCRDRSRGRLRVNWPAGLRAWLLALPGRAISGC